MRRGIYVGIAALMGLFACGRGPQAHYIAASGDDGADGSLSHPWRSFSHRVVSGELLLRGGDTLRGTLRLDSCHDLSVGSYGDGFAVIAAGDSAGIVVYAGSRVALSDLRLVGSGRKTGNVHEGLSIVDCREVVVRDVDVSGFQKAGMMIYGCFGLVAHGVRSHGNGASGIGVEGPPGKKGCVDIRLIDCHADDNPGDPTNLTNHSGNGIVAGHCTRLLIDSCTATGNGWDMPRIGNGPVGIWCYEADSVTIQHCIAYRNKTSPGAADGGGFDLDGGTTHSVIQYCLSYGNQGSGYCIFQYWGASPWHDNVIRYNVTENDGTVSDSRAGIYVWNASRDSLQFYNCQVCNNTVYSAREAAVSYSETAERRGFVWSDNIFVGGDSLIRGLPGADRFTGNDWWCLHRRGPGMNVDPGFPAYAGFTTLVSPAGLDTFSAYRTTLTGKGAKF
ncbi:MAG TPA: right-handed parallel beta-helix repeat-containing protein [Dinghuibacter sp.]|uniref:right-handed parallel beta-helix repeat-containing protein n=1 Tax=Dinghuibacter sp. TaxID=2024697 RepID=UPI002C52B847|nr:right-handed parallel beta-helix repeat-containing protein [Dinghuibacter sp.]HTJ10390.1 right-handed parallel beta-helix repeat-containing protein [Dinghuibacter sp.]